MEENGQDQMAQTIQMQNLQIGRDHLLTTAALHLPMPSVTFPLGKEIVHNIRLLVRPPILHVQKMYDMIVEAPAARGLQGTTKDGVTDLIGLPTSAPVVSGGFMK